MLARVGAQSSGGDWRQIMTAETYKGDAYCVKCKEKRDFEGTVKISDSGRRMAQGIQGSVTQFTNIKDSPRAHHSLMSTG